MSRNYSLERRIGQGGGAGGMTGAESAFYTTWINSLFDVLENPTGGLGMTAVESTRVSSLFASHSTWINSIAELSIAEIAVRSTQGSNLTGSLQNMNDVFSTWINSIAGVGMTEAESTYVASTFNMHSVWVGSVHGVLAGEINVRSTYQAAQTSSYQATRDVYSTWISSIAGQGLTGAESTYVSSTFNMHSVWISSGFAFIDNVRDTHSTWISSLHSNIVAEILVRSTQVAALAAQDIVLATWIDSVFNNAGGGGGGGLTDAESTWLSSSLSALQTWIDSIGSTYATWIDSVYNNAGGSGGGGTATLLHATEWRIDSPQIINPSVQYAPKYQTKVFEIGATVDISTIYTAPATGYLKLAFTLAAQHGIAQNQSIVLWILKSSTVYHQISFVPSSFGNEVVSYFGEVRDICNPGDTYHAKLFCTTRTLTISQSSLSVMRAELWALP